MRWSRSAALGEQTSGGVFASSAASNGVQGTIQNETVATDMAINGQGLFHGGAANGKFGHHATIQRRQ